jgi:hypothetical protein
LFAGLSFLRYKRRWQQFGMRADDFFPADDRVYLVNPDDDLWSFGASFRIGSGAAVHWL